jgi:hypothetical protein
MSLTLERARLTSDACADRTPAAPYSYSGALAYQPDPEVTELNLPHAMAAWRDAGGDESILLKRGPK